MTRRRLTATAVGVSRTMGDVLNRARAQWEPRLLANLYAAAALRSDGAHGEEHDVITQHYGILKSDLWSSLTSLRPRSSGGMAAPERITATAPAASTRSPSAGSGMPSSGPRLRVGTRPSSASEQRSYGRLVAPMTAPVGGASNLLSWSAAAGPCGASASRGWGYSSARSPPRNSSPGSAYPSRSWWRRTMQWWRLRRGERA